MSLHDDSVKHFIEGQELTHLGKLEDAIKVYFKSIELDPESFNPYHLLGETLVKLDKVQSWKDAALFYTEIIKTHPTLSLPYHFLGDVFRHQKNWVDAISVYSQATQLNPSFFWSFHFLGDSFREIKLHDEAIFAYERALSLNATYIHTLKSLTDVYLLKYFIPSNKDNYLGKLDNLIKAYFKAIELEPDLIDSYHLLAEILVKLDDVESWKDAIIFYNKLIRIYPNVSWSYHFLGDAFRHQKKWSDAVSAYSKAAEINPSFFWSCFYLGDTLMELQNWQDAISAYHRAIELNPCFIWSYHNLGEALMKTKQWPEAIEIYERALLLDSTFVFVKHKLGEAYFDLGMLQIEQNNLNSAFKSYEQAIKLSHLPSHVKKCSQLRDCLATGYYQLASQQSQKSDLTQALSFFRTVSDQPVENIYEYLWKQINELAFGDTENNLDPELPIIEEYAFEYFSSTSQYKIINLHLLTEEDKLLIYDSELSLTNLELMNHDNLALKEIYINNLHQNDKTKQIKLFREIYRKYLFASNDWSQGMYLQQSMIETGYIYIICPFTGNSIISNQSIYWLHGYTLYRFVSSQVFYLLMGDCFGVPLCVYFPKSEIIVTLSVAFNYHKYSFVINQFKALFVKEHKNLISYFSQTNKKSVIILGLARNLSHYIWNDLTAIEYLVDSKLLNNINNLLISNIEFFDIGSVFPEIHPQKIIRQDNKDNISQTIINNNYFVIPLSGFYIKEKLITRIYECSLKKCSEDFLQKVEKSRKNFPLLWITIRSRRVWLSQVEGIANIIKNLAIDFPKLTVVFDGWSRTEQNEPEEEPRIQLEINIMRNILDLIPENINTHCAIGSTTYEKVLWAHEIDLCIAPIGAGLVFTSWIANKPCVVHGHTAFASNQYIEKTYSSLIREKCVMPIFVNGVDVDDSAVFTRNYDCNWIDIYNECITILNNIKPDCNN